MEEQSFEQSSQIFEPLTNKTDYRDLTLPTETVQSFLQYVREHPSVGNNRKKMLIVKISMLKKIRKYEMVSESAGSDIKYDFLELLSNGENKRSISKTKIVQFQQLSTSDDRRKMETNGGVGQFVVKIDITDTTDLKGVEPKNFWKKINKTSYFLLPPKKYELDDSIYRVSRKSDPLNF